MALAVTVIREVTSTSQYSRLMCSTKARQMPKQQKLSGFLSNYHADSQAPRPEHKLDPPSPTASY